MFNIHSLSKRKKIIYGGLTLVITLSLLGLTQWEPRQVDPDSTQSSLPANISAQTSGPLRVNPANPRYFMDRNGKTVLLTGSHTWLNFQDAGGSDPPPVFDYGAYLDFLTSYHHDFFRLWVWESDRWSVQTTDNNYWFFPMPYERPGPGLALDGKPKFDLTKFNQAYFDRLRNRVILAGQRGIYVSVMLFNGWSSEKEKGYWNLNNPWRSHPYNLANNINGLNGDVNGNNSGDDLYVLGNSAIISYQEAYVRKVIDTVNDLDNVLYEICNECHSESQDWQYQMINYIHTYEAGKPQQHPVGMTVEWPLGENSELFASPADWISPNSDYYNPVPADGRKVVLFDTDHLCGICGDRQWAWRSFTQGYNPVFMDGYDGAGYGVGAAGYDKSDIKWTLLRKNLGYIRSYADRLNLNLVKPHGELCSTGYCLANPTNPGAQFLVYSVNGGSFTVNLSAVQGELSVEWCDPLTGDVVQGGKVGGGGNASFNSPFSEDAVLYLYSQSNPTIAPSHFLYLPIVVIPMRAPTTAGCFPSR